MSCPCIMVYFELFLSQQHNLQLSNQLKHCKMGFHLPSQGSPNTFLLKTKDTIVPFPIPCTKGNQMAAAESSLKIGEG